MDLKLPISIVDELEDSIIHSTGQLDLASGEIRNVEYVDYDFTAQGLPAHDDTYEFTSGILSNKGKDVEFRVEVDIFSGKYSVHPNELLEIKVRAAKLFAGIEGRALLKPGAGGTTHAPAPAKPVPVAPPASIPAVSWTAPSKKPSAASAKASADAATTEPASGPASIPAKAASKPAAASPATPDGERQPAAKTSSRRRLH